MGLRLFVPKIPPSAAVRSRGSIESRAMTPPQRLGRADAKPIFSGAAGGVKRGGMIPPPYACPGAPEPQKARRINGHAPTRNPWLS
jgi:hypothetical protein